jgi:hypothetical protein
MSDQPHVYRITKDHRDYGTSCNCSGCEFKAKYEIRLGISGFRLCEKCWQVLKEFRPK